MISSLVLDSSVLVEYFKQNKTELLDYLLSLGTIELIINETVLSEAAYHWLARKGSKAPRSLQEAQQISVILTTQSPLRFFSQFTVLPSDERIIPLYLDLMERYNLLPNDALILATAKLHQIPALASFDADFDVPCAGEGIQLVRDVADLT